MRSLILSSVLVGATAQFLSEQVEEETAVPVMAPAAPVAAWNQFSAASFKQQATPRLFGSRPIPGNIEAASEPPKVCNGKGSKDASGGCECDEGWKAEAGTCNCDTFFTCFNRGSCTPEHACACQTGWTGPHCSINVAPPTANNLGDWSLAQTGGASNEAAAVQQQQPQQMQQQQPDMQQMQQSQMPQMQQAPAMQPMMASAMVPTGPEVMLMQQQEQSAPAFPGSDLGAQQGNPYEQQGGAPQMFDPASSPGFDPSTAPVPLQ